MRELLKLIEEYGYCSYRAGFSDGKGDTTSCDKWESKRFDALDKVNHYIEQWAPKK